MVACFSEVTRQTSTIVDVKYHVHIEAHFHKWLRHWANPHKATKSLMLHDQSDLSQHLLLVCCLMVSLTFDSKSTTVATALKPQTLNAKTIETKAKPEIFRNPNSTEGTSKDSHVTSPSPSFHKLLLPVAWGFGIRRLRICRVCKLLSPQGPHSKPQVGSASRLSPLKPLLSSQTWNP